jgi:hypothetical protein
VQQGKDRKVVEEKKAKTAAKETKAAEIKRAKEAKAAEIKRAKQHDEIKAACEDMREVTRRIRTIHRKLRRQSRLLDQEREVCSAFVIFNEKSIRDFVLHQYRWSSLQSWIGSWNPMGLGHLYRYYLKLL